MIDENPQSGRHRHVSIYIAVLRHAPLPPVGKIALSLDIFRIRVRA
jgi:hypothetical protein